MKNFYPFTIYAEENYLSPGVRLARQIWMRNQEQVAPELIWYAVDLEVLGRDDVALHVHDMTSLGGIGEVILTHHLKLDAKDLAELGKIIKARQTEFARDEFERRERVRNELLVEGIRREMFGEV